jgi:hypothetical protein
MNYVDCVALERKNITQIQMRNDYDKEIITNKQIMLLDKS